PICRIHPWALIGCAVAALVGRGVVAWWVARASRTSRTSVTSTASDSRVETATERTPRAGEAVSSRFGRPRAWATELTPLAQGPYGSAGGSETGWGTRRGTHTAATGAPPDPR